MAVVIGMRTGFELVDGAAPEDVRRGEPLRPGPRVLRSFEDTRRPHTPRPRPLAVRTTPDPAACQVREDSRHPAVRWAVYTVIAIAAAVSLSLLYLYGSGATTVPERTSVVHVQVGDTLWDLAERTAPNSNPEAVVARIKELNNLDTPTITPGQPLIVPDGRTNTD
ncbi:nucleoid-associated protein YgaU [Saccharothrix tamanrassetensis]|uniref:Nucleoid-associated protein YgaU n=1 Tax=Saccharothrix tamanrassetensis TaxID=1051531 RepID=A0A841CUX6_9PSEU|nr:LysM peptidoglycan-binding domain-containing protein [Saccharothrix tamanrassetensis]MBB5959948.1 nucleoid-associated protein YgaU [Saccharothrix tamanrassetensis]